MGAAIPTDDSAADWVRKSFMIPRLKANQLDGNNQRSQWLRSRSKLYGLAATKYTDTSLGGNFCLNPPPQWCAYADRRVASFSLQGNGSARYGRYNKTNLNIGGGNGMGRIYSDMIDDNNQLIYMRFGVAEFNSLTTFFTGFYNSSASLLARTGRAPALLYTFGRAIGTILTIPIAPIIGVGTAIRWLAQIPAGKFYYLRPTMPLYWNAVNTIVNAISVNMGIFPRPPTQTEVDLANSLGEGISATDISNADARRMHAMLPDIYHPKGGIDIYAVATRATRIAHERQEQLTRLITDSDSNESLQRNIADFLDKSWNAPSSNGIDGILEMYHRSPAGTKEPPNKDSSGNDVGDYGRGGGSGEGPENGKPGFWNSVKGWYDDLIDFSAAELADGGMFVCFRVNHNGTVQESFSNSTRASDIAGTINSGSSAKRNARFNFAEGNLGDGAGVVSAVEGALGAVKDLAMGVVDGVHLSGIAALAGSAFADIPEHWDNSTAQMTSMSYTIQLQAWSGDPYTRFQTLIVPMAALLAGVLPKSAGKHSYTSPFLVEMYHKGRAQTRLGIIDSMSITRGTGNVGWNDKGDFLGVDITFNIKELSSLVHMPIAPNFSLNPFEGMFDEDSTFNDYLGVLGTLGLADQIYNSRRLRLAWNRKMLSFRQWTSPARWASWGVGTIPGRIANAISREIDRP